MERYGKDDVIKILNDSNTEEQLNDYKNIELMTNEMNNTKFDLIKNSIQNTTSEFSNKERRKLLQLSR